MRGVSSRVIIALVIVSVIVAGGIYLMSEREGGTGLPVYPGASKVSIPSRYKVFISLAGVDAEAYDVGGLARGGGDVV